MPEPEEKKESKPAEQPLFQLSEYLALAIIEAANKSDLGGYFALIRLVEMISISEGYDKIAEAIDYGEEIFTNEVRERSLSAIIKIQQEAAAKMEAEMEADIKAEAELANQPARKIINATTPGPAFTDDPLPGVDKDESELEIQIATESGKTR